MDFENSNSKLSHWKNLSGPSLNNAITQMQLNKELEVLPEEEFNVHNCRRNLFHHVCYEVEFVSWAAGL